MLVDNYKENSRNSGQHYITGRQAIKNFKGNASLKLVQIVLSENRWIELKWLKRQTADDGEL